MTDMHREAFERVVSNLGYYIGKWTLGGTYVQQETKDAYVIWQAAMRYRDEQDCQSPEIFPGTLYQLESLSIRKGVTK